MNIKVLRKRLETAQSDEEKIKVLVDLASCYWEQRDAAETQRCAEELLALSESAGDLWGVGKAYIYLASASLYTGGYDHSLEYLVKALKKFDPNLHKSEISKVYNELGNVYERLGKNDASLEYYQQSLHLSQEIGDLKSMAYTMNNLANIYTHLENFDKALEAYSESVRVSRLINNPLGIGIGLLNTGELYYDMKEYQKALEFDRQALEIFEAIDHQMGISSCLFNIGNVQHRLHNDIVARDFLLKALEMTKRIDFRDSLRDIYRSLSIVAKDSGDYKQALEWYRLYFEERQLLFSQEASKRVAELETRFKVDLKEKEAEIYRLKKEDLEKAITKLRDAYAELERTQSEVLRMEQRNTTLSLAVKTNDDMNQPLMVIKGNCEMLRIEYGEELSEKQEKYFNRILGGIDRIENILSKIKKIDPSNTQEYAARDKMFDIHTES